MFNRTSRPLMWREAFSEEESFEGGVKSGWISVGNQGGKSIPDLYTCHPPSLVGQMI